jgi:serine/threonine protein kinase
MGNKTKKRKGGSQIARGESSRIFSPAIPCKDGRDMSSYVSRVIKTHSRHNPSELVSRNLPLITKLKDIDPNQKYFLYPESCEIGELTDENLKDGITKEKAEFSEFLKKATKTLLKFNKTNTLTEKQKKHLKKSINLLHKHNIVHGDLHNQNIMFLEDDLPRLIDFSKSIINSSKELIQKEKDYIKQVFPNFDLMKKNNREKLEELHEEL